MGGASKPRSGSLGRTCLAPRCHSHVPATIQPLLVPGQDRREHGSPGEDGDPQTHTQARAHTRNLTQVLGQGTPLMQTPIHWAPQRQERYRPRQPLFNCRIGLGQGSPFSGCVRRCSVGGTQTGPQSDNKLGGRFSDSSPAGVRAGCHVGPPGPCRLPGSGVPRRG